MTESVTAPASSQDLTLRQHAYARCYAELACQVADVQYVFYGTGSTKLELFVVYTGDRWQVRPLLHDIEEQLHAEYPGVLVDIRYLPQDSESVTGLRRTYAEAYSR